MARPIRGDGARKSNETGHDKPDADEFTREILPLLEGVTLSKMKAATGLSVAMCARVRRGYVPHPRHCRVFGAFKNDRRNPFLPSRS